MPPDGQHREFIKSDYFDVATRNPAFLIKKIQEMAPIRSLGVFASIIIFYLFAIREGNGIKCWVCRSLEDPKCADPFDNTSTPFFDCATFPEVTHLPGVKATMCRKIRQKVNGEWRYIRSCARLGEPGIGGDERYCLQRSGTFNIHIESCTCNSKDGCNAASSLLPFNLMTAASIPLVLALHYLKRL